MFNRQAAGPGAYSRPNDPPCKFLEASWIVGGRSFGPLFTADAVRLGVRCWHPAARAATASKTASASFCMGAPVSAGR